MMGNQKSVGGRDDELIHADFEKHVGYTNGDAQEEVDNQVWGSEES